MGSRLYLLTLTLLLIGLQSPAQRHGRRHEQRARHASRLPDSVSTSDEEISNNDPSETLKSETLKSETLKSDTVQTTVPGSEQGATDSSVTTTDTPAAETPEPAPVLRNIPDTAIHRWKNSREFEYANNAALWKKQKPEEENNWLQRIFDSDAFRWFIYILLGSILLYALYKIISENNLRFFYRKPTRTKETPLEEAELPEEDLDQLLKKAVEGKEYRMATRYHYLKTLRHLDKLELIRWHSQTTDAEYVRQMDTRPQGERFRWLTSAYERVWYGKFPLDEHQFSRLSQYFKDFHNDIDHS